MKKLLTFVTAMCLSAPLHAQESKLYLAFDYMKVEPGKEAAYLETEEFWAGIHKQRALAGETLGWDLWSLRPNGTEQGYQYLTVNLFDSMEAMLKEMTSDALLAHARKAFPRMSEKEVAAKLNATVQTRDLAMQLYLSEIDATKGGPEMEEGTVALITLVKATDPSYEKMESEIFKPGHQRMVDDGAKIFWNLSRVLFPAGSDRYASHVIANMYKDLSQYVRDSEGPEMDLTTRLAVQAGLKTRDLKSVTLATLVKKVRK